MRSGLRIYPDINQQKGSKLAAQLQPRGGAGGRGREGRGGEGRGGEGGVALKHSTSVESSS